MGRGTGDGPQPRKGHVWKGAEQWRRREAEAERRPQQDELLLADLAGLEPDHVFDGGDLEGFDFVSFENSHSDTRSFQLKVDAWLFPFLNVFGLYGKVDGSVDLDVFLDGNLILERLGTDCTRPILRPPLCDPLEDQVILLRAGRWSAFDIITPDWLSWL